MNFEAYNLSIPELISVDKFKANQLQNADDVSIGSMSISSFDSLASGVSLAPFYFSKAPKLPHIDTYISRDDLKFSNIKSLVKSQKKDKPSRKINKKNLTRRKAVDIRRGYTQIDIKNLLSYIDDSCGNKNGEISLDEFESAIRKYKHAKLHSEEEENARNLILNLSNIFKIAAITPKVWFKANLPFNNLTGKPFDTMNWSFFHEKLNKLCVDHFANEWSNKDIFILRRFADPMSEFDSNNELTETEFLSALNRLSQPPELSHIMKEAGFILDHIEAYMQIKQVRARDIFNMMNRGNNLDLKTLQYGIEHILEQLGLDRESLSRGISKELFNKPKTIRKNKYDKDENFSIQSQLQALSFTKQLKFHKRSSGYGYGKIIKNSASKKPPPKAIPPLSNELTCKLFPLSTTNFC